MEDISVITAISHPLRRRIYDHLLLYGTTQVTALARALESQVGSVSHHLRMLERAGLVQREADPTGDRRTSWWRLARRSLSWSSRDYADSPAAAYLAREAQRLNLRHQLERLQQWNRVSGDSDAEGFSTDALAWATAAELTELQNRVTRTIDEWRESIDREDGQERMPVFFFAHGFPTEV